jgi:hypothetical protein
MENSMQDDWPDYCCVPALVESALRKFACKVPERKDLALRLGVKVPSTVPNSMRLPVSERDEGFGVNIELALRTIPILLNEFSCGLVFMHLPFDMIDFRDYEYEYERLCAKDCFVGAGLNWPTLLGVKGHSKHVVRILRYGGQTVLIYDPLHPRASEREFPVSLFEQAVLEIGDGFWIFSSPEGQI